MLIASTVVAGCAARVDPAPLPPAPPADGAVHVLLSWAAPVDLDLYVTDPAGEALYFGNNPTRAGARLEADSRCGDHAAPGTGGVEHAVLAAPVPGTYRIGVDYLQDCGTAVDAVPFRVVVARDARRRDAEGMAHRGMFNVIVLEFEVGEDGHLAGTDGR